MHGFLTYATMRNLDRSSIVKAAAEKEQLPIRVVQLDVIDDRSVKGCYKAIVSEAKK